MTVGLSTPSRNLHFGIKTSRWLQTAALLAAAVLPATVAAQSPKRSQDHFEHRVVTKTEPSALNYQEPLNALMAFTQHHEIDDALFYYDKGKKAFAYHKPASDRPAILSLYTLDGNLQVDKTIILELPSGKIYWQTYKSIESPTEFKNHLQELNKVIKTELQTIEAFLKTQEKNLAPASYQALLPSVTKLIEKLSPTKENTWVYAYQDGQFIYHKGKDSFLFLSSDRGPADSVLLRMPKGTVQTMQTSKSTLWRDTMIAQALIKILNGDLKPTIERTDSNTLWAEETYTPSYDAFLAFAHRHIVAGKNFYYDQGRKSFAYFKPTSERPALLGLYNYDEKGQTHNNILIELPSGKVARQTYNPLKSPDELNKMIQAELEKIEAFFQTQKENLSPEAYQALLPDFTKLVETLPPTRKNTWIYPYGKQGQFTYLKQGNASLLFLVLEGKDAPRIVTLRLPAGRVIEQTDAIPSDPAERDALIAKELVKILNGNRPPAH